MLEGDVGTLSGDHSSEVFNKVLHYVQVQEEPRIGNP